MTGGHPTINMELKDNVFPFFQFSMNFSLLGKVRRRWESVFFKIVTDGTGVFNLQERLDTSMASVGSVASSKCFEQSGLNKAKMRSSF